jgi:hypothetical protein
MSAPTPQQQADGVSTSEAARRVAEDLGFGPGGKEGGVILVVVDHKAEVTLFGHAGDLTPMYQALKFAIGEMLKKAAELTGGERVLSSVQKWRARTKS